MKYKTLRITEETYALLNKARAKYVKEDPQGKVNYDLILSKAIKNYLGE